MKGVSCGDYVVTQFVFCFEGNKWRTQTDEFGFTDPFGSDAMYGAIARAMIGECYDLYGIVEITKEQGGFFLCAVSFA